MMMRMVGLGVGRKTVLLLHARISAHGCPKDAGQFGTGAA
jgi:hypothetical protein